VAKGLKELEQENNRLKRFLAEAEFDKAMLYPKALGRNGTAPPVPPSG
jgi:hypothetical protein